jgi:arabinose-5-phosphate isomerase
MNLCKLGLAVVETEAQAVFDLSKRINQHFESACELLLNCKGRIVVTGMGKSGHIGRKIAATLASTGSPAFFMHPGEANHGDMGMITHEDVLLAISYSGQTSELITLLPLIKRLGIPLLSLTGNVNSILAKEANITLDVSIAQEACPHGLAPTTSTTVALVMGDALAITLLQARGFSAEDFAFSHPGGSLGKRLILRVEDIYHSGDALPVVKETSTVSEALIEVTDKKLGMTCVTDTHGALIGVYTDGDIRRTLTNHHDINTTSITTVMTSHCHTIPFGSLAAKALLLMETHRITSLIVVDELNYPLGVIHLHDILRAGLI